MVVVVAVALGVVALSVYRLIGLSVCLPAWLPACLSVCVSVCLPACLSVCLSVCLSLCKLENAAILRDFLIF